MAQVCMTSKSAESEEGRVTSKGFYALMTRLSVTDATVDKNDAIHFAAA